MTDNNISPELHAWLTEKPTIGSPTSTATEGLEVVAYCNERVLRGDVGDCSSVAAIKYWSNGDWVDKRRVEDQKHPLVTLASAQAAVAAERERSERDYEDAVQVLDNHVRRITALESALGVARSKVAKAYTESINDTHGAARTSILEAIALIDTTLGAKHG